jgi:hypothetical protein
VSSTLPIQYIFIVCSSFCFGKHFGISGARSGFEDRVIIATIKHRFSGKRGIISSFAEEKKRKRGQEGTKSL